MSERDYSKQVAKRQRIRDTTLVVGVDVGSLQCGGVYEQRGEGIGQLCKGIQQP